MTLKEDIQQIAKKARDAWVEVCKLTPVQKKQILLSMADSLDSNRLEIVQANQKDLELGKEQGLPAALMDRLELSDRRIDSMVQGLRNIASLEDPLGQILEENLRPNGLRISKVRVPIGVIGIIYESRPNVTADATALCFMASNVVILRGGKEASHSNRAISNLLQQGAVAKGLTADVVQLVDSGDRQAVKELVQLDEYLDLIIPRGGEGLIRAVTESSRVPVIKHYKGVCHTYIDKLANREMSERIVENAKCQRPGVCNAIETLLVHREIAEQLLPALAEKLIRRGVEIRGDKDVCRLIPKAHLASEKDWEDEYLSLILAVKIVDDIDEAISHISRYGSAHSDAIITEDKSAAEKFVNEVDSACVYINASTRFTDGAQFGMGAEIGISTDKLHARGPMGLLELTTYKYIIRGEGQIVE